MAATDIWWLIALAASPSARVRSRQLKKRFYGRRVSAEGQLAEGPPRVRRDTAVKT